MKSTFRILFYGRTNEQRKDGTMPLTARIVDQTVSREMDKLSAALSGTSFSLNGGALSTKEIAN